MKQIEQQEQAENSPDVSVEESVDQPAIKKKRSYLPIFLFVIFIAIITAAGFQGWQLFMQNKQQTQSLINELQAQLALRPTRSQMDNSIGSIRQSVQQTDSRLSNLEQGQQGLVNATEKLYELYGRDENGWKLAEVEYLMSVAQHKLVLENDFEGAAKTLNAASYRIADLADPGLLAVRVRINEEVAQLKTRSRPDLVGMTLLVSRLTRQISFLTPGYQAVTEKQPDAEPEVVKKADPELPLDKKLMDFMTSLVTIKTSQPKARKAEQTIIVDVREKLEDNLKLTRWALLERDAFQYAQLMNQNVSQFKEYYDLENAANNDFFESLLKLQKSQIRPELPDISGSLRLLKELQRKRENEPQQEKQQEIDNG